MKFTTILSTLFIAVASVSAMPTHARMARSIMARSFENSAVRRSAGLNRRLDMAEFMDQMILEFGEATVDAVIAEIEQWYDDYTGDSS